MSLTNATYFDTARLGNVRDNWLVELYDSAGGVLRMAQHTTTVGGHVYRGMITGDPSIRESIDLEKMEARTGNVTVDLANGDYHGAALSAELFAGARVYYNQTVKIYSQLNSQAALASCLHVFTGRLTGMEHDGDRITLTAEVLMPWSDISIPQVKHGASGLWYPLAYGEFIANVSTPASPDFCGSTALFPVPVSHYTNDKVWALMPRAYSSGAALHIYERDCQRWVPLMYDGAANGASESDGTGNAIYAEATLPHAWRVKPIDTENTATTTGTFTNPDNAIDNPDTEDAAGSYATDTLTIPAGGGADTAYLPFGIAQVSAPMLATSIAYKVRYKATITSGLINTLQCLMEIGGGVANDYMTMDGVERTITNTATGLSSKQMPTRARLRIIAEHGTMAGVVDVLIYDVIVSPSLELPVDEDSSGNAALRFAEDELYCGAFGLQDYDRSGSGTDHWITGSSTPTDIKEIHQAHRDLIHRYTSYTGDPDGWAALDTAREDWLIRWWLPEPMELKKALAQLQYEGRFVALWEADGDLKYVYVKSSYSAGDVAATLAERDISQLKIGLTPFDEMITEQVILWDQHPAENRTRQSKTRTNTTPRTSYAINTKENSAQIELAALVTDTGPSMSAKFGAAYEQIVGDVYLIGSCDILAPRYFLLQVGDVIQFSDAGCNPFGGSWAAYYLMVTETRRGPGKLSISWREVYS